MGFGRRLADGSPLRASSVSTMFSRASRCWPSFWLKAYHYFLRKKIRRERNDKRSGKLEGFMETP